MVGSDPTFEAKQDKVLEQMRASIVATIDEACKAFAENMSAAGYSEPPPPREYFASCVMQLAYRLQCGADVEKFAGGDPRIAWHAIKNAVDISNHYWGSNFELRNA
jgi:hypothetical protein